MIESFLVWGNNNASFAASSSSMVVDMSANIAGLSSEVDFISIQRSWKVVETGNVKTVKVSVPEVSLSATITPPGNFLMFISDTPSFSPSSEYRVMTLSGANLETTYDFVGTKYITFGYAPQYIFDRSITFDGVRDYMDADNVADLAGNFTISAWVRPNSNNLVKEIVSKRNLSPYTEGYSLRLQPDYTPRMSWIDAGGVTQELDASLPLPLDEWHHLAVIYDGSKATFYIDGIEDTSSVMSPPVASDQRFLVGAANFELPTHFFVGSLDEVRVWNQAITVPQLRYMMNQEIEKFTDASVKGKILPQNISKNEIAAIPFSELEIYLPMNKYTFTNVQDESDNAHVAAIKNLETVDFQTAPLPYITRADGAFTDPSTWVAGAILPVPGAVSIVDPSQNIDWNIVQSHHNVATSEHRSLLALEVLDHEFTVTNDKFLSISHYLRLDGRLDLEGESQLIQTENSDLEPTSIGRLERDQQGTIDTYSYNFYSSPVGTINTSQINQAYTIGGVMNDGTTASNPISLNFSGGLDGAATSPITISSYWMFKFANTAGGNNDWQYTGPFGSIDVGLGYTMKGPGTTGAEQNYTFIGKPNNSTDSVTISHPINAGNNTLVGNPFPSSIDADMFIGDNGHLSGTLYFWEHWGGGNHILSDYEGGYAMYTLSGGTPAVSHPLVSNAGVGTKVPTKNIAVGQGFFVSAAADGTIEFKNTQRKFSLETSDSVFFFWEPQGEATEESLAGIDDDDVDPYSIPEEDLRPKFRIGFDSPQEYHRQLLLTVDENATNNLDRGYDGIILDAPSEDMSWWLEEKTVAIQGVPNLTDQTEYPLRVLIENEGVIKIGIDHLENVDEREVVVYLKDNVLDTHFNLYGGPYEGFLEAGEYVDRFSIVFVPVEDETTDDEENEETTEEDQQEEWEETSEEDQQGEWEETSEEDQQGEWEETSEEDQQEEWEDTSENENDTSEDSEETNQDTNEDTNESGEDTTEDESTEDTQEDMQVIEMTESTTGDSMELREIYANYNDASGTIVIRKHFANDFESVQLFSMLGQVVGAWQPNANETEVQLQVGSISTGTYILYIETAHGRFTKKLIIH